MRALSAGELLTVWEQGLMQQPVQRALALLTVACQDISPSQLAQLSIGRRDGLLLTLREGIFGSQIQSIATCSKCGERLELTFDVADIRTTTSTEPLEICSVQVDSWEVEFRLPNSLDLIAITSADTSQSALLERCLLQVREREEIQPIAQLPTQIASAVVTQMAKLDPQADVQLNLCCPACSHQWLSTFDIVSFFWSEIHAWAIRTLREVHILASTYGWGEAEILTMSPYRRRLYLEMIGG
ncbi:phage baseplate protein [Calothrix rhizosoleniae]|uniref:T4 family baseplate hub assembly chaperone n=1 Tax=Calothrix rhizosoleniae TaxID=888997 RepID=UPI000B4999A9|nr:phage baseplate protein [Calothrix rhizosoleniae]